MYEDDLKMAKIVAGIIVTILIVGFFVMLSPITIVGAGEVGVAKLFGKVDEQAINSGIHVINPLKSVHKMDIRTQEYTMSIAQGEGEKSGNDSIDVLTKEGLTLALDVTVLYHLNSATAPVLYRDIGTDYKEKIVRPEVRNSIREIASNYTAQELYTSKREEYNMKLTETLNKKLSDRGLVLETVLLRNIRLPKQLRDAIETKQAAEQEAEKMNFVLDKEKKEAERKTVEAAGIRDAQEIIAQKLSPEYLRWYSIDMMKNLADSPNTTFLFVPIDESGMPIINISK